MRRTIKCNTNHFPDIKGYASVIENRLDDDGCTMEGVLADHARMLEFMSTPI